MLRLMVILTHPPPLRSQAWGPFLLSRPLSALCSKVLSQPLADLGQPGGELRLRRRDPKVRPPSSCTGPGAAARRRWSRRSGPAGRGPAIERARPAEPRRHAEQLLGELDDALELAAAAGQHQAAAGERQLARSMRARTSWKISSTRGRMISVSRARDTIWTGGSLGVAEARHLEPLAGVAGARQHAAVEASSAARPAARPVDRPNARSWVTCWPPSGTAWISCRRPSAKRATPVTPPPRSSTSAPERRLVRRSGWRGPRRRAPRPRPRPRDGSARPRRPDCAAAPRRPAPDAPRRAGGRPIMPRGSRSGWPPSRVISTGSACSVSRRSVRASARAWASARARSAAGHRATAELELDRRERSERGRPAGEAEHDLAQRLAGLLLGLVHHRQDRGLGRLGVDDLAGAQPFGQLIAGAQQLEPPPAARRAIRQHILVVPMSSTPIGSCAADRRGSPRCSWTTLSALHALADPASACGSSRSRMPVGQEAQVDDRDRALEQRVVARLRRRAGARRRSGSCSGSSTSIRLSRCRVQRRSPTQVAATTRSDSAGSVESSANRRRGVARRALADQHAQVRGSVLRRRASPSRRALDHRAGRGRSGRSGRRAARARAAGARSGGCGGCPAACARRSPARPRSAARAAPRAASVSIASIGWPTAMPSCAAQRLRLGAHAAVDVDLAHREAGLDRSAPGAGRRSACPARAATPELADPDAERRRRARARARPPPA